jgi:hypothetical protein
MSGAAAPLHAEEDRPRLVRTGSATQLLVRGKPFVMLAGEVHNSSASGLEYMEAVWPKLEKLNVNTVLAPISWELFEPQEGVFDYTLVDGLIVQARRRDMKLVLLWFASWKNGVSSYAPAWIKRDTTRFPRCKGSSNQNTKNVLSPLGEATMRADAAAFRALMRRVREIDGDRTTVIMVQIENEVGIKPEPRDLSPAADRAFSSPVPAALTAYLTRRKETLIPELRAHWARAGFRTAGTWTEVFGTGLHTDEIFSAWHYARYMNAVAEAGKAAYPLPMYVNAWLRGPGAKPGDYPSGGPLAHVMDIWRAAAPSIDFVAPDIYLPDFKGICAEYTQSGNPLMIPEARTDDAAVARAFWAVAELDAICFAPFGIEHMREDHPLREGYRILAQLVPFMTAAHGTGRMAGIYRQDPAEEAPAEPPVLGDYRANIRYMARGIPKEAPRYGLLIHLPPDEFIVAGYGFEVNFSATVPGPRYTGILSVDMGAFTDGRWERTLRLNGDETGANHRAKIPPNPRNTFLDPSKPRILRVRVYRYD